MSVISVRLSENEEKMLAFLSQHYEKDTSALIKHSLHDLYEDVLDKAEIDHFENQEKKGKVSFVTSDDLLKQAGIKRKRKF